MIRQHPKTNTPIHILLQFQLCWIVNNMTKYRRNRRLAKADRNPCDCWNECSGHPTIQTGMKRTRYLWQGCTRTGGRGGQNRHNIFLWTENTRTGHLTNDKQRPAYMKWRHMFGITPYIRTEPVASIMDLGGTISSDRSSIRDFGESTGSGSTWL